MRVLCVCSSACPSSWVWSGAEHLGKHAFDDFLNPLVSKKIVKLSFEMRHYFENNMDCFLAGICVGFWLWNVESVDSLSRRVFLSSKVFFNFSLDVIPKKEGGDGVSLLASGLAFFISKRISPLRTKLKFIWALPSSMSESIKTFVISAESHLLMAVTMGNISVWYFACSS